MTLAPATLADWRSLVDKELLGRPFDKTLVHEPFAGLAILPLYVEARPPEPAVRYERREPFRICMRHAEGSTIADWVADVENGADALWVPLDGASGAIAGEPSLAKTPLVLETSRVPTAAELSGIQAPHRLAIDPIGWRAGGRAAPETLDADLGALGAIAGAAARVVVSTLPHHDAGADAADEIAIALSTGTRYVEALLEAGLSPDHAAAAVHLRIAVGRDTFIELCKLRALRLCWAKVLGAFGARAETLVHAVCSPATLASRDPWVNMLRVTTQVFAAVIGGADLVTPAAFDETLGAPSELGRRVARNTGLVLREESALGRVSDAAGGSYAFEAITDALAREAWSRFRRISADGGIAAAITSGRLAARLEASWKERLDRIVKRKHPILGVSEFANLDERTPHADERDAEGEGGTVHRDAEPFETLRLRSEAIEPAPEVLLVPLGSFAESRARAGFSAALFGAGGIRTREGTSNEPATVACLCGTDERYALEAAERARQLKALGVGRVVVAGRPGALEGPLRQAGVDGFFHVGCDVVAFLAEVLATFEKQS